MRERRAVRPPMALIVAAATVAALMSVSATPAWAQPVGSATDAPAIGGFGIGDALESAIDEQHGALRLTLPLADLGLVWESHDTEDRFGFGPGWNLGLMMVGTKGGVRAAPPGGGSFPVDPTHPSGLAGYGVHDVRFEVTPGQVLDGRADGLRDAAGYDYAMAELGGTTSYFDDAGRMVARITRHQERTDWLWGDAASASPGLRRIVSSEGAVTALDWSSEPGAVLLHAGANVAHDDPPERRWRLRLDAGRLTSIEDPLGGTTGIEYDGDRIARVTAEAGAVTDIAWALAPDGVVRVRRVRTTDAAGAELSAREWRPIGARLPSGWPEYDHERALFRSGDPAFRYETEVFDGATRVRSVYSSLGTLQQRSVILAGGSGSWLAQTQVFSYPGGEGGAVPDPDALPGNWSRPAVTEATYADPHGATRTTRAEHAFDALGRATREVAVDGAVTITDYDPPAAGSARPPIGLPVRQLTIAPDGSTEETLQTLNDARTAVIAVETRAADAGAGPVTVARAEYDVESDGFIGEQRVFPAGDPGQPPVISRWQRAHDPLRAEVSVSETLAAGTPAESTVTTTRSVVDGRICAEIDALGHRATAVHDPLGREVRRVDQAGRVTTTRYESARRHGRNAVIVTTPDGVARTEEFDAIGRVTRVTDNLADGLVVPGHERLAETRRYPGPGSVEVTDAWGSTTTMQQDPFGRGIATVSPTGQTTLVEHDDVASTVSTRVTSTGRASDAEHVRVERQDANGRRVEISGSRADGRPVPRLVTAYDGFGRVSSSGDGRLSTVVAHDAAGNAVRTATTAPESPGSGALIAERRFNGFGTSLEKSLYAGDERASAGSRSVDGLERVRSEWDQLGRATTVDYTVDGLVARRASESGRMVEHRYDAVTRGLVGTTVSAAVGTVTVEYELDPVTDLPLAVFDPDDRAATEIRTRYDGFGNPVEVRYPDGARITSLYDRHGRKARTTDPAGRSTWFSYDAEGLLIRLVQRDGEGADAPVLAEVEYRRDAFGRPRELIRGNGVTTTATFTSLGEVATETTRRGDDVLAVREYEYDGHGLLVTRVDRVPGDPPAGLVATSTTYRYDEFGRLTGSSVHDGESEAGAPLRVTDYELTVSGDIRTERSRGDERGERFDRVRTFEYSPLGELVAVSVNGGDRVTQEYDDAGNLVRALDGAVYEYDAANRPVLELRDGGRIETEYWADGRRRLRSTEAGATTFYWDGDDLLAEAHRDPGGAVGYASYLTATGALARTHDGAPTDPTRVAYYGVDRHGNVMELTDSLGRSTVRYDYSDYGTATETPMSDGPAAGPVTGLARNPLQFSGAYAEADGSLWLRARSYDPSTMRFSTMDVADLLNGYNYADLNPIMMLDPSGREPKWDWTDDAILVGVAAAFAVSTAFAAVFTGGWSLSLLGVVGWVADVVTVLAGVARIDASARGAAIDPELDEAMRIGEVVTAIIGGIGALQAVGSAVFGSVRALQRAESKFTFHALEPVAAYPNPKRYFDARVAGNRGELSEDLITMSGRRFASDAESIAAALQTHRARLERTYLERHELVPLTSAAAGCWLTRPLRAEPTLRRAALQMRRSEEHVSALTKHEQWLGYDAAAVQDAIDAWRRGAPPHTDARPWHEPRRFEIETWYPPASGETRLTRKYD